jgi:mannosyltransferase
MKQRLPLLAILLLGFALRLHHLSYLSVWLDESHSILAAKLSLPELIQFVASRSHPPLYFLLLHGWIVLGDGEFVVRFLSVLWGLVGIAALYTLGRRMLGVRTGTLAALLLAVSPIHIWHSQDARMYPLLLVLAILSSYFLLRALARPRPALWLIYGLLAAAALYTQNTAALTLAAQGTYAAIHIAATRQWRLLRGLALALATIALLYLPWLPLSASQASHLQQYFWISSPTPRAIIDTFDYLSSAFLFQDSPWHSNLDYWPGSLLYLAYLALFLLGARQAIRRLGYHSLLLFLLILLPVAGEYAVSQVRPIYLNRTLLVVAAPLFILYAAGGLGRPSRTRVAAYALLVLALALNAFSLSNMFHSATKEGWREAAGLVTELSQAGEAIFFDQGIAQVPFNYYSSRSGLQLDEYGYPRDFSHWEKQAEMEGDRWWVVDYLSTDPGEALTRLMAQARRYPAVWLVVNRSLSQGRLEAWLQANSVRVESYTFPAISVHRFQMRDGD